ncbi:hypothetical protein HDU93_007683 [Gonapodya sp. JEL0774]|nr:hypothetical protein HDU93_007683 [Gonapodya sp. JEL0774]
MKRSKRSALPELPEIPTIVGAKASAEPLSEVESPVPRVGAVGRSYPLAKPRALAGKAKTKGTATTYGRNIGEVVEKPTGEVFRDETTKSLKRKASEIAQEGDRNHSERKRSTVKKPLCATSPDSDPTADLPPPLARLGRIFRAINAIHSLTCARRDGTGGGGGLVRWDVIRKGCEEVVGMPLPPSALVPLLPITHPDLLTLVNAPLSSLHDHTSHTVGGLPQLRPEDDENELCVVLEGTGVEKISWKREELKAKTGMSYFGGYRGSVTSRAKPSGQRKTESSFSKEVTRRDAAFMVKARSWWEQFVGRQSGLPAGSVVDKAEKHMIPDDFMASAEEELKLSGWTIAPDLPGDPSGGECDNGRHKKLETVRILPPMPDRPDSLLNVVRGMTSEPEYRDQLVEVMTVAGRVADYVTPTAELLSSEGLSTLAALGITSLYSHQASALAHLQADRHVILATGTGSGKSLVYWCWLAEGLTRGVEGPADGVGGWRALVVYPTKALAQDQLRSFKQFLLAHPTLKKYMIPGTELFVEHFVSTYDGDTPQQFRRSIRENARVILTNPDTLHVAMLPSRELWGSWWKELGVVVIDELHTHSAAFGSHTSHVFRRLRRMLRHHSNSHYRFVAASATLPDPPGHLRDLVGLAPSEPVAAVEEDGSPSGVRHHAVWNPPMIDPARPGLGRRSSLTEAAWVARRMVAAGQLKNSKYRRMLEILLKIINTELDKAGRSDLKSKFVGYRAGYMPEDRRRIERALFTGDVMCVASTTALELGVDIGYLGGRAGRRSLDSISMLVCDHLDPISQHFSKFPKELVEGKPESLPIDPWAKQVAEGQMACTAGDLPVNLDEDWLLLTPEDVGSLDAGLRDGNIGGCLSGAEPAKYRRISWLRERCNEWLMKGPDGLYYLPPDDRWGDRPSLKVPLRDIDETTFIVVDMATGVVLEEIEHHRAIFDLYEGAVFLHQGETFLVTSLNVDRGIARVRKTNVRYAFETAVDTSLTEWRLWHSYVTAQRDYSNVDVTRARSRRRCLVGGEVVSDGFELPAGIQDGPMEGESDAGGTVWGFYGDVKSEQSILPIVKTRLYVPPLINGD